MDDFKNDFFVTFNSGDGIELFSGNSPSHFKFQLATPLYLPEGYYCGLMELHFPSEFYNIHSSESEFNVIDGKIYNDGAIFNYLENDILITFDHDNGLSFLENLEIFFKIG